MSIDKRNNYENHHRWLGLLFRPRHLEPHQLYGAATIPGGPQVDLLVTTLRASGASVQPSDESADVAYFPFTVPGHLLQVNGDRVQFYLYPDEVAAKPTPCVLQRMALL